ncbi:MFS transporter [Amnibacterium kyonggiense]|uniref:Putative MFS family arabinose efflux permease n=1 Tax=Amnibacterium kyonggiense TaxID=595671 RepID=A0A4R7FSA5_9MICO|nr:MFS transporter [Amnibacterium kyonggiense]TDS80549.1 putative MFS family arabinose efflux permease [Amnibacterium kyonggiense]
MSVRTAPPPGRFDRRLLAPMILGSILNPINSSIIAVALVPIAVAFGAPASETAWLVSALYVATAIGQPLVGRLVDVFGPRRLFLAGTLLTGVAGLIGALAPSIAVLVVARIVLGFGTCSGYPASMVLIRREAERTGQASPAGVLTALAVATQTVAVVGPTLGGLLVDLGGWRATFAVNVPLAVAGVLLGLLVLPKDEAVPEAGRRFLHLDWAGVALFAGVLVALLLFLMDPHVETVWLLGAAVVAAAAFAWRELRARDPFIDVRVFAGDRALLATYARSLLAATVSYGYLYGFTQWLEDGRGLTASAAGLVLLSTFVVGLLVSITTGRRPQVWPKLLVGGVVQVVVSAALLLVTGASPIWFLVAVAAVLGVPQGMLNLANQNALYFQADPDRVGASAGLLRTFMYLGAIVSSSASAGFFGQRADTGGLHELAVFMLVACVLLVVLVLADRRLRLIGRPEPEPA